MFLRDESAAGDTKQRTARAASALGMRTRQSMERRHKQSTSVAKKPGKLITIEGLGA